jgi:hypothetical protein
LKIPFGGVKSIDMKRGVMKIAFSGGEAAFHLGPGAEKWAEKIRNPRRLLDKLGVKPGMKVSLLGHRRRQVQETARGAHARRDRRQG